MGYTRFKTLPFYSGVAYKQFDIINNGVTGVTGSFRYYYGTYDSQNQNPNAFFRYQITSWSINDEVVTTFFNKTGSGPVFSAGSLIRATGTTYPLLDFTGIASDGGENYIRYIVPSFDTGLILTTGFVETILNPAWTTGFFFIPSYSNSLDVNTRVIRLQFGDGYSQRQRDGINSNIAAWGLSFENRSDKEAKAIINFTEDKGDTEAFQILFSRGALQNDVNQKYTASQVKVNNNSYNQNTITLTLNQVFDI